MEHMLSLHGCGGECDGQCAEGACEGCGCDKAAVPEQETEETE